MERTTETAEMVLETFEHLSEFEEYSDITAMYKALPAEELVVRREDPQVLLDAMTNNHPLEISFVGGVPYANSVAWNPHLDGSRGLNNAFLEGYSHLERIVTVFGFTKPDGFYFEKHPESKQQFASIDRSHVRTASGYVPNENIEFITVRFPIAAFPEARMTEIEKDSLWEYENDSSEIRKPVFIYRGFMQKQKAAHHTMAA